jgi:predicted dinucleotide-binding enzyme
MTIAIIGTGIAGRTLALVQRVGYDVVVGTRDPDETGRRDEWAGLLHELGWQDVVELDGLDNARAWRCGCGYGCACWVRSERPSST